MTESNPETARVSWSGAKNCYAEEQRNNAEIVAIMGELSRAVHGARRVSSSGLHEYSHIKTSVLINALHRLQATFFPWCDFNPVTSDFALFLRKKGDCENRAAVSVQNGEVWLCHNCASLPEWSGYKQHPLRA